MLKNSLKGKDIVKLHKSGGVVSRSVKIRQRTRSNRIRVLSFFVNCFLLRKILIIGKCSLLD